MLVFFFFVGLPIGFKVATQRPFITAIIQFSINCITNALTSHCIRFIGHLCAFVVAIGTTHRQFCTFVYYHNYFPLCHKGLETRIAWKDWEPKTVAAVFILVVEVIIYLFVANTLLFMLCDRYNRLFKTFSTQTTNNMSVQYSIMYL